MHAFRCKYIVIFVILIAIWLHFLIQIVFYGVNLNEDLYIVGYVIMRVNLGALYNSSFSGVVLCHFNDI